MQLTINSNYGISKETRIYPNIKKLKIIPTIPHYLIIITTYKEPNHTSSITLFNEDEIIITPEINDKIYPKLNK